MSALPVSSAAQVGVIVIGYNDAGHIADAVLSALRQGTPVAEVVAVDDASTDGTAAVLDALAARYARLRVVHRTVNSGGCGTPRNEGLRHATAPYVMFLDSDDVLEPGAVEALYAAAARHRAQVAAGLCVRRELPGPREVPWQRALFVREAVYDSPDELPRLVRDTLCVNKLYDRAFLAEHSVGFPEGAFRYEDFVFTARLLAARPRIALIPDTVYVWHVRRSAARPSLSLDRDGVGNWRSRLEANRLAVEVFEEAGRRRLAHAARVRFLDHDLRMYGRELAVRSDAYRTGWWRLTREHLDGFDDAALRSARAPARWLARVIAASDRPRDVDRLVELAGRPARLLPPYARAAGRPVWAADLPAVELDGLDTKPLHRLPVVVEGEPRVAGTAGRRRLRLRVRVRELYGRLAAMGPATVDVELRHRADGRVRLMRDAALTREALPGEALPGKAPAGEALSREGAQDREPGAHQDPAPHAPAPDGGDRTSWTAEVWLAPDALAAAGSDGDVDVFDLWVRLRCADGSALHTTLRAVGSGLRRTVVPSRRHGLVLVRPHATGNGSLALRVAAGPRASAGVTARRLRRLVTAPAARGR